MRGYDLNPAMLIVARARTLASSAKRVIPALSDSISRHYLRSIKDGGELRPPTSEPLEQWLQPATARAFRALERSVSSVVLDRESLEVPMWAYADQAPADVAFFYVALFRTLRYFISEFLGSNPTWVKTSNGKERVRVSHDRIHNRWRTEIGNLLDVMQSEVHVTPSVANRTCLIKRASSLHIPLPSGSVDAVISSPPYCTRIDYVRATLPELAVISYPNGHSIRQLREEMIGTPTIHKTQEYDSEGWGTTCSRFLSAVEHHSSKASSTYYLKYYRQYFASAFASLREIDRVLKKSGTCLLVVQDSCYKEVPNDLPRVFSEMAEGLGLLLKDKIDFHVKQTMAGVNLGVKRYRQTFRATESVLVFSRQSPSIPGPKAGSGMVIGRRPTR
jgi:hypothetical protein